METEGNLKSLKVEIQLRDKTGVKYPYQITSLTPGVWQQVAITKDQFAQGSSADFSSVFSGFMATVENGDQTFRIDDVRWDNGTDASTLGTCQSKGAGGSGGSGGAGGGGTATGGSPSGGAGATAGNGGTVVGGTLSTGGVSVTGGASSTGGSSATGGASSSGGATSGGASASGGAGGGGGGSGGNPGACPLLYSDSGLPAGADIWTWDGSTWGLAAGTFDGASRDCDGAPEGAGCFKTVSGANSATATNYAGWGVVPVSRANWDLSGCTRLLFCAQTGGALNALKVEVQESSKSGVKHTVRAAITPGAWQLVTIKKEQFGTGNFASIFGPFYVTAENGGETFRIDNVRWDDGTGSVADTCGSPVNPGAEGAADGGVGVDASSVGTVVDAPGTPG